MILFAAADLIRAAVSTLEPLAGFLYQLCLLDLLSHVLRPYKYLLGQKLLFAFLRFFGCCASSQISVAMPLAARGR